MRYTYVHVVFHMQYKSRELGEMQGVGHRRETVILEVSQRDSLCQAEPGRSCWSLLPTVWAAGYWVSYTNIAQVIPTWFSLGLTGALELAQGCTEPKTYNFTVHPCSLPQQTAWNSGEGKKPRFNISASPHSSLVHMLRTNNKMYHAPLITSWQTTV